MSEGTQPVAGAPETPAGAPEAEAVAGSPEAAGKDPKKTFVSNMNDLKETSPELYNQMLKGLAMTICHDLREHNERFKKLLREGQRQR
jgi:hypothetical protein